MPAVLSETGAVTASVFLQLNKEKMEIGVQNALLLAPPSCTLQTSRHICTPPPASSQYVYFSCQCYMASTSRGLIENAEPSASVAANLGCDAVDVIPILDVQLRRLWKVGQCLAVMGATGQATGQRPEAACRAGVTECSRKGLQRHQARRRW